MLRYNVASEYSSDGQCQLELGSLIPLTPILSISQPATFNSTEFQSTAIVSFNDYIGFGTCSGQPDAAVITTPAVSSPSPLNPLKSSPDQNPTESNSPETSSLSPNSTHSVSTHSSGSYDTKVEIANGVAIPVGILGLVLLGLLIYRHLKTRKILKEEDATSQEQGSPREDAQPYLQQKGELEAEGKRKHELEARERRYEMGNEGERYELPVEEEDLMIRTRQELRGEEHSTELEVPH
ncbi:hypothetical protein IMSHALPRED_002020 [Imshaugia aleurites]|uniref:Uncharacterized protein n=1 Tax=Imshaugia aleurites TaxID=172621 RepID=A0A8H3J4A7_9LECA|nr:hypothetical protein IMSHALPRED_002020 [Imshaugia aleurites]